jgi:hypothetical protein
MTIAGDDLVFQIALDGVGKNGVMRGAFRALRGNEMPDVEEIESYHRLIRQAMAEGVLPQSGSFLPYIRFTLEAALERGGADGDLPNAYTAGIFALAKVCGAQDFSMVVGRLAFEQTVQSETWGTRCDDVLFNERVDSRRHFVTSAALQAASNRGFAVSIGEFKELYDTISGAGGFDFTDMAANLSGIRMSNTLMGAAAKDWPKLLDRIETENDVIVPFDGVPQLMPEEVFKVRFGDVESARYRAMISRIEAEIDSLALHAR